MKRSIFKHGKKRFDVNTVHRNSINIQKTYFLSKLGS